MVKIRGKNVGFRNQLRHQLTRLCVMTEADTLAAQRGIKSPRSCADAGAAIRLGEGVL